MNKKEKDKLRDKLYKRDGKKCYYCGIKEEDFIRIWGEFYGGKKRGQKLEVDRKDNKKDYIEENCVLSCAICNNAKSDKFMDEEFKEVGNSIKQIWLSRSKMS
jgi:5-methylcytosine-specific restriction endonuclease McrA